MSQLFRRPSSRSQLRAVLAAFLCASAITSASCGSDSSEGTDDDDDDGGSGAASFTKIYNSAEFKSCAGCHAPGAVGQVAGTERTQDWSTRDKAYASLKGKASGMTGNFSDCNGVAFLGTSAANSLLVASLDEDVRESFKAGECDGSAGAVSDMTLKIGGPLPASLLAELKAWVAAGAPNN